MKSFKIKILVNLIAICSVILFCNAQNSSNAQTQTTEEKKSSLQKGMDPIFDMYHSFLDTVMPYNFYDESDSPFSKYLIFTSGQIFGPYQIQNICRQQKNVF